MDCLSWQMLASTVVAPSGLRSPEMCHCPAKRALKLRKSPLQRLQHNQMLLLHAYCCCKARYRT